MEDEIAFITINTFVDVVFWMDIVLQFRSSYIDHATGREIFCPKMIASNYIFNGSFVIDFMSTFPFSQIFDAAGVHYSSFAYLFADIMSLLKAQRLLKILKKIRGMPITIEDKAMMQVIFYAFCIFVYTHIIGCILWLSFKTEERWIPAVDFGAVDIKNHLNVRFDSDGKETLLSDDYVFLYQWFTAWYNSSISFALVEVNARTTN